YTVVASDTVLGPQKVLFPFSLIRPAAQTPPGVPAGRNELIPAWVLSDNLYAVQRAQAKCRARNRASRHAFEFDVFRPESVDRMRDACGRLDAVGVVREVYTDRELNGLGKNFLTEAHRVRAL